MIRVLHYDYTGYWARPLAEHLERIFMKHPDVDYQWLNPKVKNFSANRHTIETLLPEIDVLLIHPGVEGQNTVRSYADQYPHCSIAFLVPEVSNYHERDGKVEAFGWHDYDHIEKFVLSARK